MIVVFVFLQSWRASIIPVIAIPVSLVGTFTVLYALGISLNNLSLFGLVLAVGIVVDDAIVVVENVERNLHLGMTPRSCGAQDNGRGGWRADRDRINPVRGVCAVGVPVGHHRPVLSSVRRHDRRLDDHLLLCLVELEPGFVRPLVKVVRSAQRRAHRARRPSAGRIRRFNRGFDWLSNGYGRLTRRLVRATVAVLVVYLGLVGLTGWQFSRTPTGYIPEQDQGILITLVQLPPGASLDRTQAVIERATDIILNTPGIEHVSPFVGLDAITFTVASNTGAIFMGLPSLYNHHIDGVTANTVLADVRKRLSVIQDAMVLTILPPPVQGLGNSGGFKMMVQDRAGFGSEALARATQALVGAANKDPAIAGTFTLFSTGSPAIYADIDRVKAQMVGLTPTDVFSTLQVYLGSQYVNDFNYLGRTFQVIAQADGSFRRTPEDISRLRVRNVAGEMVPIGTVAQLRDETTPYRVPRYNLFPAAEIMGTAAPGVASGTALKRMEELARDVLPRGIDFEWTELAFQQRQQGTPTLVVFGAAALLVFLVLAAQYESWKLPLAVVLIVPMCLLASVTGLTIRACRSTYSSDRLRGTRWARGEERDPDRGVRAPVRGGRRDDGRCCGARGSHAPAPHSDDVVRVCPWCRSPRGGDRCGRGNAPIARHSGVLWHAGSNRLRPPFHAGFLYGRSPLPPQSALAG